MNTFSQISARLDRLPLARFHYQVIVALGFVFFFEFADLNTFAYAAPQMRLQFGMSIDSVAWITSVTFLGMFVGAAFGGRFADVAGRRKGLVIGLGVFSIFSLFNAIAWDVPSLLVIRFLTGIGLSAMTVCANTYLVEIMPASYRGKAQSIVSFVGHLGIPAMAFMASVLVPLGDNGWRFVFLVGGIGLVALPLVFRLPESPRWLMIQGRHAKATTITEAIEAKVAATTGPLPALQAVDALPGHDVVKLPYRALFQGAMAKRTMLVAALWIFTTLGYYGFLSWVPTLLATQGISVVKSLFYTMLMTLGAAPGALLAWPISNWLGRRKGIALVCVLTAVFGVFFGFASSPVLVVLFGFCVSALLMAFGAQMYLYSPELFPTSLRNSGNGLSYGLGRLANVVGPLIIAGIFNSFNYQAVFVYIAGCWLLSAAIVLFFAPKQSEVDAVDTADTAPVQRVPVTEGAPRRGVAV